MLTVIDRMITWTEHYGLADMAIVDLLRSLVEGDAPPAESEDARKLAADLRGVVPDPLERAKLVCRFMQIEPAEESDPEDAIRPEQFLPILLDAIREIVETRPRETALQELAALL